MNYLYRAPQERPAQIPCFENVLKRKEFADFVNSNFLKQEKEVRISKSQDDTKAITDIFYSMLYFVFKEIYYHGFLQEEDLKDIFLCAMYSYQKRMEEQAEQYPKDKQKVTFKWAARSFVKRINNIKKSNKDVLFGGLCQQIMTDYNMQNNREMKVEISRFRSDDDKESYEHFPLILRECIKEAFTRYLFDKKELYGFLTRPECRTQMDKEEFCRGWQTRMYAGMKGHMDSAALAWYALAHFLNQRQLNRMIGTFRSHIQFLEDIDKRSQNANRQGKGSYRKICETDGIEKYKKITEVLEFVLLFCGRITNDITDYFSDDAQQAKEEYAEHLARYVQFNRGSENSADALQKFCGKILKEGSAIYFDGEHPIPNKNIIKAMMYGNAKLLEACVKPITEDEIHDYYKLREELDPVFQKKEPVLYKEEQEKLRQFQNIKNRIELTNVTIYMEILDDLMGQLISWAYLRERDLMYFQLGYYYIKLYYSNIIPNRKKDRKHSLRGEKFSIADGAILYQFVAIYSYHLPVYTVKKSGMANFSNKKKGSAPGDGVNTFVKTYSKDIYLEGLQLFTKRMDLEAADNEIDENVEFRKYIDHFKYFSNLDRSMLELYSVMFDRFFAYSSKLHKSVPVVLQNILAKYFVIANVKLESEERPCFKGEADRTTAVITLDRNKNDLSLLRSDCFTYKVLDRKMYKDKSGKRQKKDVEIKLKLDARDSIFLYELENILQYVTKL